jgi:hypothetical protein
VTRHVRERLREGEEVHLKKLAREILENSYRSLNYDMTASYNYDLTPARDQTQ